MTTGPNVGAVRQGGRGEGGKCMQVISTARSRVRPTIHTRVPIFIYPLSWLQYTLSYVDVRFTTYSKYPDNNNAAHLSVQPRREVVVGAVPGVVQRRGVVCRAKADHKPGMGRCGRRGAHGGRHDQTLMASTASTNDADRAKLEDWEGWTCRSNGGDKLPARSYKVPSIGTYLKCPSPSSTGIA